MHIGGHQADNALLHKAASMRFGLFAGLSRAESLAPTDRILQRVFSAATNGGNDRNLSSGGDWTRESTCISDMFIADEDINMFTHLPLLGYDAIANPRIEGRESRQRVGQSCGRVFDLDCTVSSGKFAQGPWNMKSDRHGSPLRSTRFAFRQRFRLT